MSVMSTMPRHQAREIAFQYLFANLPQKSAEGFEFDKTDFVHFCSNFGFQADDFAWELVKGTGKNLPSLDQAIAAQSTNWRLERMPLVDLTIIRMAAYEILHISDIPKTVSINEAIECAKSFGAEDSPSFVNGILDKLSKPS